MFSINDSKDGKEGFDNIKFLSNLEIIRDYASQHMKHSQLFEGINMFLDQYRAISKYESEHKMVIAGAIRGITRTIETYLFDKELTTEDKDVKNLVSELKDIMVNIEQELELEAKLEAIQKARLK